MVDREGQPYEKLKTAFLYRTTYTASCTCKPAPWSDEAQQRHAMYATKEWQQRARKVAKMVARSSRTGRGASIAELNATLEDQPGAGGAENDPVDVRSVNRSRVARSSNYRSGRMGLGRESRVRTRSRSSSSRSGRPKWKSQILFGEN
jgi:hypothetical protein